MRRRKEEEQKSFFGSKSPNHLHHPHYRHTKSTHAALDRENQFEAHGKNRKTIFLKLIQPDRLHILKWSF